MRPDDRVRVEAGEAEEHHDGEGDVAGEYAGEALDSPDASLGPALLVDRPLRELEGVESDNDARDDEPDDLREVDDDN
jgi:hypothetical protein